MPKAISMKHGLRFLFAALASFALCGEALAAEFEAATGKEVRGRCHMDSCDFFALEQVLPVKSTAKGTLYAVAFKSWSASYKNTGDDKEYDRPPVQVEKPEIKLNMVFCSKTKPVIFDYYDGAWHAGALRPGDESAVFGYNESAYYFYYAACHRYVTGDPVSKTAAAKFGYRFAQSPLNGGNLPDLGKLQPLDIVK
jgi:hypothetical protein